MESRLQKIRLLLLDVDGVMTDGRIVYDERGGEIKAFDVKDGHGIKLLQRAGIKVGIITGRQSPVVDVRAGELDIDIVFQGVKDKIVPYAQLLQSLGLNDDEVAYVGDDIVDLPVLRRVGFAVTVADGLADLHPFVDYVTIRPGGRGAVREVCDLLLKGSGRWAGVTERYFGGVAV
ncbi:MAG: phenylphosphate carboxylase subunit delta [Desulfuromonadales bacterium GWD2_61_12]|nr:MAG: phenylphosphate carboxylase subunit delta [Desulfuromonadales bacterium GWC2_61_20]OGR36871.1 MAG: phenylphosphate carboxylase subunit delta [Desulfuromonadales bacterium GWD2_61_12]HAD03405.1 phenylphosphate carboxylase subunit delta [Desulfuromonas sp.]HBT82263.1 phenylphosphate carboxylase subunit delta [Desulfuromonas sp.]